jgi:hypothetical protein
VDGYSRTGMGLLITGKLNRSSINGFRPRMDNCMIRDRQKEKINNFEEEEKALEMEEVTSNRRKRKFEN